MYREFIYMDTDRLQSIVAQLNEGALTQVVSERRSSGDVKVNLAANVLSWFLPVSASGGMSLERSAQTSKVVHDYAFEVALNSLENENLLLDASTWNLEDGTFPDRAFVLVRGEASVLDYGIVLHLAENKYAMRLFAGQSVVAEPPDTGNRQARRHLSKVGGATSMAGPQAEITPDVWFTTINQFIEAFMKDALFARIKDDSGELFAGPLVREFLREDIHHLIFKRGSSLQSGWTMLAQISRVPEEESTLDRISARLNARMAEATTPSPARTPIDALNVVIEAVSGLQEAIASVSYPAVSVTPIAIYREVTPVR